MNWTVFQGRNISWPTNILKYSTSLAIQKYKLKLLWDSPEKQGNKVGDDVGKEIPFYNANENVNWYSHYGNQYDSSSKT